MSTDGANSRLRTPRLMNSWQKYSLFKNVSSKRLNKWKKGTKTFKRKKTNLNLFKKSSSANLPFKKKRWSPFTKKTCSRSNVKSQPWRKKSSTMKKPWRSIALNWKDCRNNCKITRKSSLSRKNGNSSRKSKRRPRKTISKSFCQTKDSLAVVSTLLSENVDTITNFCYLPSCLNYNYFRKFC